MSGDPLGVAHHRQQVTGRQRIIAEVANADLLRQEVGIGDRSTEFVAMLGLRAPMDAAIACDRVIVAVNFPPRFVVKQAVHFFTKNKFAHQPTAVCGEPGKVGMLSRK